VKSDYNKCAAYAPIYKYIYEEEEEDVDVTKKDLDLFFEWLKCDGLKPKKSERLWRKTILKNLLNDHKMTLENYHDFLEEKEEKMTKTITKINIDDFDYSIVINKTITIGKVERKVNNYIEADSMLHLFFMDGTDLLVRKEDINNKFIRT